MWMTRECNKRTNSLHNPIRGQKDTEKRGRKASYINKWPRMKPPYQC